MVFKISKHDFRYWEQYCEEKTWSSICDVGKTFSGKKLTFEEYLSVEDKYWSIIAQLCQIWGTSSMSLYEIHWWENNKWHVFSNAKRRYLPLGSIDFKSIIKPGIQYKIDVIEVLFRSAVREYCFCARFRDKNNHFIQIGYDMYFYIGNVTQDEWDQLLVPEGIHFKEIGVSPYGRKREWEKETWGR